MSRGENRESKLTSITTHLSIQKKSSKKLYFGVVKSSIINKGFFFDKHFSNIAPLCSIEMLPTTSTKTTCIGKISRV